MKNLREAVRLWLADIGLLTTSSVIGCCFGLGFGCAFGAFYFATKMFVVITARIFG